MFNITLKSSGVRYFVYMKPELISVSLLGLPRTSNHAEGWHNRINSFLGCAHPQIFKFVESLKKEQILQEVNMSQLDTGANLKKKKKQNLNYQERSLKVVESFDNSSPLDYVKCVARKISL